jgi:hypothetical protein
MKHLTRQKILLVLIRMDNREFDAQEPKILLVSGARAIQLLYAKLSILDLGPRCDIPIRR